MEDFVTVLMQTGGFGVAAMLLSVIVMALTEYLKLPLISTPHIRAWLVKTSLAYEDKDGGVTIWVIPYFTFVLGLALSIIFSVDLVTRFIPTAPVLPARILTGVIVGIGSNFVNKIVGFLDSGK
jgi:hypothetical protein